ncbi:MAG: translocation/assembly module TamB domain-containing protein [Novosphingobium sp.]
MDEAPESLARRRHWGKWAGGVLLALVLLAGLLVAALNSSAAKRYVIERISGIAPENGLRFEVQRIEGSLFGRMDLIGVAIRDRQGVFLTAPKVTLDWRPQYYLSGLIDIRDLNIDHARLIRSPRLIASTSNAPLLPDLDFDVARIHVGQLVIEPAVAQQRQVASIDGKLHIADRRADVDARLLTARGPGVPGGDKFTLHLSALPKRNVLAIDARLNAPAGGLVSGMTGMSKPLQLGIVGHGDWKHWQGALTGQSDLAPPITVALAATDGRFTAKGVIAAADFAPAALHDLLAAPITLDAAATLAKRRADVHVSLRSDTFTAALHGGLNGATSAFEGLAGDVALLRPTALAANMAASGLRAHITADGAFAAPRISYDLAAASLGFNGVGVEGLHASGQAQMGRDHFMLPVSATARRVTGLSASAGELLTNVRINGDLAIQGPRILSDNLKIKSDRLDATALLVADTARGVYTGAINGRLNNYRIESVGVFNVTSEVKLVRQGGSGFSLSGRLATRSTRLFSSGVQDFLGGNISATTQIAYGGDGVLRFSALRMASPLLRVTNGAGRYTPGGAIDLTASGTSAKYGPLDLKLSGTIAAPVALVRASKPGMGIGLADLTATIRGDARGYAVKADGTTHYGPFLADAVLLTGQRQMTIDLKRGVFAGVNFAGTIAQSPAGPFTGVLRGSGSGIAGTVTLSPLGKYQRALIAVNASNASIPGQPPITIGRAIVNGSVVLYDVPHIEGEAQIAGLHTGALTINAARAQIVYQGNIGQLKLLAEGSNGIPFRVAANGSMTPQLYRIALNGRANGIDFKTAAPAEIRREGAGYRLQPTQLDLTRGTVRLTGTYASSSGYSVQSLLSRFDLSLINGFAPGLGISGSATGRLNFAQASGGGFPTVESALAVSGFSRASLSGISEPVDLALAANVAAPGSDIRAVVRRGGTVVGRIQARLGAAVGGATWADQLSGAALSGGIRYNGPAGVLFSFAALPDQTVAGPIAVAADFSGRVAEPQLVGLVHSKALTYVNETYGTRLTNLAIDGRFSNDRFNLTNLTASAGSGTVAASGTIGLSSASGFPVNLNVTMNNAQLARSDALGATATGTLTVLNGPATGALIKGTLTLPETRYKIVRAGAAEVPELTGVRRKPALGRVRVTGDAVPGAELPGRWKLDLQVKADRRVFVSGMGLESEWQTDLHVGGTSHAPIVTGRADIVRGTYSFSGKRFELTRGTVRFQGGPMNDPELSISASATVDDLTATLAIEGSAQHPRVSFGSVPSLPQDEVVSRLLFGQSVTSLSTFQVVQLAASLNSLRGGSGGLDPLGKLRAASGIDRLRILGADATTGRGTALAAGKYITDDIYIEVITDARGFTATQLEYALSKSLSILSQMASFGTSNISVRYSKDY